MANFGPSKTWTDGEILSHTDLNAALLDIINNVTNNNIDADNIDETDDYTWSGANSFTGGHSIKVLSNAASSIVTGTTLEWDPGDGGQMTDNSSGISLDFKLPDASDNQDVFASIAAICLDDAAGSEDGELSFRVATAGTNTEKMTLSNSALTVTPAITASGGITGSVTSSNATITGGSITGITDIAIADGGTGASTAAAARTNLGLEIGVDVQAYDAELQALSGLTPTDSNIIVGNGSTFVTESGATARTSLGLGSIATQSASAVSITGGSLTGMTSYSGGTISGTTGTFSGDLTVDTNIFKVDSVNNSVGFGLTNPSDYAFNGTPSWVASGGASNASVILVSGTTSTGYLAFADGTTGTDRYSGNIQYNHSTNTMSFRTNGGVEAMTINSAQDLAVDTDTLYVDASADRVGINTSSPEEPLTVVGGGTTTSTANFTGGARNTNATLASDYGMYYQIDANNTVGGRVYNWRVGGKGFSDGTSLMTLTSAGNLGLGTTSPEEPLTVLGGDSTSSTVNFTGGVAGNTNATLASDYNLVFQIDANNTVGGRQYNWRVGGKGFSDGTSLMSLTNAGLLGIGTESPSESLTNRGNVFIETNSTSADSGNGLFWHSTTSGWNTSSAHAAIYGKRTDASNGYLRFDTRQSGTTQEAMRVDSSGNLLVGRTGTAYNSETGLVLSGVGQVFYTRNASASNTTFAIYNNRDATGTNYIQFMTGGTTRGSIVWTSSSTAFNTTSDYRLKENIVGITDGITRIKSLKPSRFNFIENADRTVDGFVAHEVSDIVPEAISGAKDAVDDEGNPQYQGIDQSKLVPLLTAALQEAITKIETLETKVAALEAA